MCSDGGTALFVQLGCDRDDWLARVPNESRRIKRKLTDPDRVVGLFNGEDPFTAMPVEPCLRLDTTHLPPAEVAARIVEHYGLQILSAARGD